ncbi:hypothetical protein Bbelb_142540 [Branchiostoma belcheri]|nr:hypothetical protein Bbelb_142540 [Branchiostoma belcheri]
MAANPHHETSLGVVLGKNTVLDTTSRATGQSAGHCEVLYDVPKCSELLKHPNMHVDDETEQVTLRTDPTRRYTAQAMSSGKDSKYLSFCCVSRFIRATPYKPHMTPRQEGLYVLRPPPRLPGQACSASVSDLPRQSGWTQISFS